MIEQTSWPKWFFHLWQGGDLGDSPGDGDRVASCDWGAGGGGGVGAVYDSFCLYLVMYTFPKSWHKIDWLKFCTTAVSFGGRETGRLVHEAILVIKKREGGGGQFLSFGVLFRKRTPWTSRSRNSPVADTCTRDFGRHVCHPLLRTTARTLRSLWARAVREIQIMSLEDRLSH